VFGESLQVERDAEHAASLANQTRLWDASFTLALLGVRALLSIAYQVGRIADEIATTRKSEEVRYGNRRD
jgi:hypothetical protein